jgi:hypothetical protein
MCRVRPHRDGYQLAIALPLDTGTGPAPGTPVRSDDIPGRRRPAGADAAGRRRYRPQDLAPPYPEGWRGTADRAAIRPPAAAPAITVTVDSTFIRSREDEEHHFEVRVGNVETKAGGRQVFGGVAKAGTDIEGLIRKNLDAVGGNKDTVVTAFTDGCPGLRGILAGAGVVEPPGS